MVLFELVFLLDFLSYLWEMDFRTIQYVFLSKHFHFHQQNNQKKFLSDYQYSYFLQIICRHFRCWCKQNHYVF